MFRSVDGCASSSGRRRDTDQEEKTKKDYTRIKAEGVRDTSRLQDKRKAAEEGARQSEEAEGVPHVQRRSSSS